MVVGNVGATLTGLSVAGQVTGVTPSEDRMGNFSRKFDVAETKRLVTPTISVPTRLLPLQQGSFNLPFILSSGLVEGIQQQVSQFIQSVSQRFLQTGGERLCSHLASLLKDQNPPNDYSMFLASIS